jgi:hypothetical protein
MKKKRAEIMRKKAEEARKRAEKARQDHLTELRLKREIARSKALALERKRKLEEAKRKR